MKIVLVTLFQIVYHLYCESGKNRLKETHFALFLFFGCQLNCSLHT